MDPLFQAIFSENFNCLRELIKSGSEVDIISDSEWTPLHAAVSVNRLVKSIILANLRMILILRKLRTQYTGIYVSKFRVPLFKLYILQYSFSHANYRVKIV